MAFIPMSDLKDKTTLLIWLEEKNLNSALNALYTNKIEIGLDEGCVAFKLKNGEVLKEGATAHRETYLKINDMKVFYICQDITDALTVTMRGMNAISLNGMQNLPHFLETYQRNKKAHDYVYVLAFHKNKENDELVHQVKDVMAKMCTVAMRWVNIFLLTEENPTFNSWYNNEK